MIGIAFGTRPEWIKIKPVCQELSRRSVPFTIIFTGQHKDLVTEENLLQLGANSVRTIVLPSTSPKMSRLDSIASGILTEDFTEGLSSVMVQGDTTSAFSVALAAFHRGIPVIHLEAGLRTYDLQQPFPEEANRQMISSIASLHLCPTDLAKENLLKEGRSKQSKIVVTGNTALDNIRNIRPTNNKSVLVTMHRRENHKDMKDWLLNIDTLAKNKPDYHFLIPLHPNPNVTKHRSVLKHVEVVEPMTHPELVRFLASCDYVITDSGGVQEESSFFRKPCVVCRRETERKEGLDNFSILCREPSSLARVFEESKKLKMIGPSPYGDGHASEKVVEELMLLGEIND
tara:strand:+ start:126 stop:1157 length:1032 start_codon:yes stop_codon:yes gene_type:complete